MFRFGLMLWSLTALFFAMITILYPPKLSVGKKWVIIFALATIFVFAASAKAIMAKPKPWLGLSTRKIVV